jgi:molecular chaperone GrpE
MFHVEVNEGVSDCLLPYKSQGPRVGDELQLPIDMIFQRTVLVFVLAIVASSEAFTVVRSKSCVVVAGTTQSTIRVSAAEEGEATEEIVRNEAAPVPDAATDILNSPEFLKRKLEVLKSDMAKAEDDLKAAQARLEAGKAEWGGQIDDLQKEYQNIQQRMNTQSNKSDDMATSQVVREMLAVLDNFDRAFGQVTASNDEEKAIEAEYRKAYADVLEIFKKLGVEEIETIGTEFNYEVHQAVMQKPSEDYAEGIVCEELQKGFKIGDTLIRAAMVAVTM